MLTPELDQQLRSVDYTNFLPMGRVRGLTKSALKSVSPESIRAGAAAFERDVAQYDMANKAKLIKEFMHRRKLAAEAQAQAQFRKVWPEGMSEQLVNSFIKRKPFIPYKNNRLQ